MTVPSTEPSQYPALPQQWTIDGLGFNDGSGRYLSVEGWTGQPAARITKTDRVSGHGVYLGGKYYGPRIIEAKGVIRCPDVAAVEQTLDALALLCTSGGPLGRYVMSGVDIRTGRHRLAEVVLDDDLRPQCAGDGLTLKFDTQLLAADPRMYGAQLKVSNAIALEIPAPGGVAWNGAGGSGVEWNGPGGASGLVYQTGPGQSGLVELDNAGNWPTPATLTITTDTGVTGPGVQLLDTGERLELDGTLNPGSVLVIDTGSGRVSVDGIPQPGALSRYDLFQLQPGRNTLYFYSSNPGHRALLSATWRDGYQGG